MFIVKSKPFANLTQGLSGQSTNSLSYSPYPEEQFHSVSKRKSNWWKVILIIILIFSGVGIVIWFVSLKNQEEQGSELPEKTNSDQLGTT